MSKIIATLQSESAECGLASIAMVASAHGLHVGLAELPPLSDVAQGC